MDGNRRFARLHNLPLKEGHRMGGEALMSVLDCCFRLGVKNVTTYAFSIENFNRNPREVETIFSLLKDQLAIISNENGLCNMHDVKVKIIGNKAYLPKDIVDDIEMIEKRTKLNTKHKLFIALSYTSRDDMLHSATRVVAKVANGEIGLSEIDEKILKNNFYYEEDSKNLDILVRTSGHTRLSDYMLWQCHQDCMIKFSNILWPDYRFYCTWWTIFKWSYYKTLNIQDAEKMQVRKLTEKQINEKYRALPKVHPPFASVTKL